MSAYVKRRGCTMESRCRCQCNGTFEWSETEGRYPGCFEQILKTNETIVIQEEGNYKCVPVTSCQFGSLLIPPGVTYKTLRCKEFKYSCQCTSVTIVSTGIIQPNCVSSSPHLIPSATFTMILLILWLFKLLLWLFIHFYGVIFN